MKQRVDQLLTERGLAESWTRVQALILAGLVYLPFFNASADTIMAYRGCVDVLPDADAA